MTDANPLKTAIRGLAATAVVGGALGLSACSGSGSGDDSGTLSVGVTDAPVDSAQEVVVRFDAVEIKPAGGPSETIELDSPEDIHLLEQQGANSAALLDGETVDAGEYNWMRLHIDAQETTANSYITTSTGQHSLFIPSGAETGLKLVKGFTVPANGSADFTIDFDLRQSVHEPGQSGGDYILKPALRLVDNTEVGHIAAEVDSIQNCPSGDSSEGPAIYVFEGSDVTADDVDGNDPEPVTTAQLNNEDNDSTFTGTAGFLTAGTYTVAFTCQAANDANDADDNLAFQGSQNMDVQADETVTYSHTVTAQ